MEIKLGDRIRVIDNKFHNGRIGEVVHILDDRDLMAVRDIKDATRFFCVRKAHVEAYSDLTR